VRDRRHSLEHGNPYPEKAIPNLDEDVSTANAVE
jgi:hypothetical protein